MIPLSPERIGQLIEPYFSEPSNLLLGQLGQYLEVLLRWNARQNLTAIRDPESIVRRHFGESLFLARHLPDSVGTLLDLGSGAGFPGLPVQLAWPNLRVTLAESQRKKASFLREVIRELHLPTEVWEKRAEDLPTDRIFDVVALRAVDNPVDALQTARRLCGPTGTVAHLTVHEGAPGLVLESSDETQKFWPFVG